MQSEWTQQQQHQKLLHDACRDLLGRTAELKWAREKMDQDLNAPDSIGLSELWRQFCHLGLVGAAIPEAYGGIGLGPEETAIIAEHLGRSLTPLPYASSVYLAAGLIQLAASEKQKQRYLPLLAQGTLLGTLAYYEGPGSDQSPTTLTKCQHNTIRGTQNMVLDGSRADFAIVLAQDHDLERTRSFYIVDLHESSVTRQRLETIDPMRDYSRLIFADAPAEPLGDKGEAQSLLDKVLDQAAVFFAMEQLGGAEACLEDSCTYAKQRYSFGRPIGSYQAIKHKLAHMYIKNTLARSLCQQALTSLDKKAPNAARDACAARLAATAAFSYAAKESIQIHGGNGFTWEYDCHLYYRRAISLAQILGGPTHWQDRLIEELNTQGTGGMNYGGLS